MSHSNKIINIAIFLLIFLVLLRSIDPRPIQIFRATTFDFYQRLLPRMNEKLPISIIDIDERSLSEIGQWPWPRITLVKLIENLSELEPLVIGFDMIFPESDRFSSSHLVELLAKLDPPIIVNQNQLINADEKFAVAISKQKIVLGTMLNSYEIKDANHQSGPKVVFNWNQYPGNYIHALASRVPNLIELEHAANSIGVFTLLPEVDGIVRRIPTLYKVNDQIWPSFGLEMLRSALMEENVDVNVDRAGISSITVGGITLPTDQQGLTWLQFNPHNKTRFVSAVDVLNNQIEPNLLLGHIILIGTSASGLHDIKMTPLAQQMPGVEIWSQWLESALFGDLLERPNYAYVAEILFLIVSGLLLILLTIKASARVSISVYLLLTIACIGFSWWMYKANHLLIDASFPVMSIGVLFAWLMLMKFWQEEQQRKQIKTAFSHYLSPDVVHDLAMDPDQLKLGGEQRLITSMFTDLEGFTELSEKFKPEELVDVINQYLDGICQIVIDYGGTIDKIIGDAVHVLFGAPKLQSNHADLAVECGLQIDKFCSEFRQNNQTGYQLGLTRIGINSGFAVVGNFGGKQRFDYTAYGDTINTASRLESATQYLGSSICVSESTRNLCKNQRFRPVSDLVVKGKSEAITVYQPFTTDSILKVYLDQYQDAYFKLKNQDTNAVELLKTLQNEYPDDEVVSNLLMNIETTGKITCLKVLSEK